MDDDSDILPCPSKLVNLPKGSIKVEDADEETFDLYSTLSLLSKDSATTTSSNLDMVDGKKDILIISLTINPPRQLPTSSSNCSSKSTGRSSKATKKGKAGAQPVEIDILIAQDMQRLRGSGGDTGSVVWRSSLHLLSFLLPQLHFPSLLSTTSADPPFLSPSLLPSASILELGSGTGLLAIPLAPFVKRWVCSDQEECLKLVAANLATNGLRVGEEEEVESDGREQEVLEHHGHGHGHGGKDKRHAGDGAHKEERKGPRVGVEELDWFSFLPSPSSFNPPSPHPSSSPQPPPIYDLIVSSDCIYNPHLLPPLIATFSHFTVPNHTVVLVMIELRSADVIREFLELWLEDGEGRWEIRRLVGEEGEGGWGAGGGRFVGWVGWRTR